jgi:hypothetical protein
MENAMTDKTQSNVEVPQNQAADRCAPTVEATRPKLIDLVPPEILAAVTDKRVKEAVFGAGPSCMGKGSQTFDPPAPLAEGIAWLERYRHVLKVGHLAFDDGTALWFDRHYFLRYDGKPRMRIPQPGVTMRTAPDPNDE